MYIINIDGTGRIKKKKTKKIENFLFSGNKFYKENRFIWIVCQKRYAFQNSIPYLCLVCIALLVSKWWRKKDELMKTQSFIVFFFLLFYFFFYIKNVCFFFQYISLFIRNNIYFFTYIIVLLIIWLSLNLIGIDKVSICYFLFFFSFTSFLSAK